MRYCLFRVMLGYGTALALTACEPAKQSAKFFADNLKDSVYETAYAIDDWANTPPKGEGELLPVPHRYCYRAQGDILCYRQPMPGWEGRLVAYQGTDAKEPPRQVMQLLPKSAKNEAVTPESRVAGAKPVFNDLPKQEALPGIEDVDGEVEVQPDSANEVLPDPTASPQL